jgi:hypothetical protein
VWGQDPAKARNGNAIPVSREVLYSEILLMPHFCGHTHSTRDRRGPLISDHSRPRAGDPLNPFALPLSPSGMIPPAVSPSLVGSGPGFTSPANIPASPAHEQIAALAYSYWEARGRQGGSPEEDWLRAERELRGR